MFRPALLGACAAVLLTGLGAAGWLLTPTPAQTAGEVLPMPPQPPPRLAEGPQYESCMALLRTDPEGARAEAETWMRAGGGDGAAYCGAMALLALGEPTRAAERLEAIAGRSQAGAQARGAVFAQAAQAWLLAEQPGRAYAAATLALTLLPDDPDLLTDRAIASASLGRYSEAKQDLDRAVTLAPDRAEPLVFRAAALRHLDRLPEAARDIERALALDADNPEALLERGILRQLQGDTAGARADWERTIAIAPDSPAADLAAQNLALNEAGPRRR